MANVDETHRALSFAQVERELFSAETYLAASAGHPLAKKNDITGQKRDSSNFRWKLHTRPILSEERRREILAKLSCERHSAQRNRRDAPTIRNAAGQQSRIRAASDAGMYKTPEERYQLIKAMLDDRMLRVSSKSGGADDNRSRETHGHPMYKCDEIVQDEASVLIPSAELNHDGIYFASDILNNPTADDTGHLSKFDHTFEWDDTQQKAILSQKSLLTQINSSLLLPSKLEVDELTSSISSEGLLRRGSQDRVHGEAISSSFGENGRFDDTINEPTDDQKDRVARMKDKVHINQRQAIAKKVTNRINVLAQPRNEFFAEREKQRIECEMEQLRECTFHPSVYKLPRSMGNYGQARSANRLATTNFQWLTLSPRQENLTPANDVMDRDNEKQNVIQRLHLDGTARYDLREQARKALEVQNLQNCTFKPKINPISKTLISSVDYKPIHHRIYDLQRAKAESLEHIREQQERKECGLLLFTPTINPKSKEIAANKLTGRQIEASSENRDEEAIVLHVTDRLVIDADAMAERKTATQEYFDMVNEQPFAPQISETSKRIVEQKPEFKMDFVARQQYFQSRDQEKLQALEGVSDMIHAKGEKLTFKPDIGNADGILRQLRPDRCTESNRQQLYRLTYNDRREVELKRQRIREAQYAQCTFKPKINSVSKALGRSSTLDELSHPVLDIQSVLLKSKGESRKAGDSPASRVALRQYFANKRFRSRIALEMEEASKAECTFRPNLVASKYHTGSSSARKLCSREPQTRKLEWQSGDLLHLIEAERQKKADVIKAKRNAQELKELNECTFQPNLQKPRRQGKSLKTPPLQDNTSDEKPIIVRGLGRFLELRELARKQQTEQKQREQKLFAPNTSYEPRTYTVPKPFNLSKTSKQTVRRRLKVREEIYAKERLECTFSPETVITESMHFEKYAK